MPARALVLLLLLAAAAGAEELFNARVAAIEPFEREVPRGKSLVIKGLVKGAFKDPQLILIAPNGRTYLNRDNEIREYGFTFTVKFDEGAGPYRLEIIASKPNSTQSAARFTVWYAARRPEVEPEPPPLTGEPDPVSVHARLLEKRFVRLLNGFRRSIHVDAVGWNEAVAARAREHAERMAAAQRRQHRFGREGGVLDLLQDGGAGPGGLSGPQDGWTRLTSRRPFDRPVLQPPGPKVWNHVVVFVLASDSLPRMFEQFFVREAAFRICAADPYCLEVGVGAARTPPPEAKDPKTGAVLKGRQSPIVYYCVCFVQVNDRTLVDGQDDAYRQLLRRAAGREPELLRALGVWGRDGPALSLLGRAARDDSPVTASAAFDGLLLLDEEKARAELARLEERRAGLWEKGHYADAIALFEPLRYVTFDGRVGATRDRLRWEGNQAAAQELAALKEQPDTPERAKALRDLKERAAGLPVASTID